MDINAAFPSKWLKAADILGRTVPCIIHSVTIEKFQDGSEKPALWFQGKEKAMILNKTNAESISVIYGSDTDGWAGKGIELYTMKVTGPNGITDGIRIRIPERVRSPVGQAAVPESDLDDPIPF